MKTSTSSILQLFFNDGETICVSPDKYGYHSVYQSSLDGDILLKSPNPDIQDTVIHEEDINMMAINPIGGFRNDANVTAYRSFLVELDDDSLAEQKAYVNSMKMPYSVCVFSGNKSLHYGIVLKEELPDYNTWRIYAEWILNIMKKADPMTKNPSRSIRFPNNKRHDGKQLVQSLVEIKDRISLNDLNMWIHRYPDCKPIPYIPKPFPDEIPSLLDIPEWIILELENGIDCERNNTWFRIAAVLAGKNFMEYEIIAFLEPYFTEQPDFKYNEWMTTIRHGIKTVS